MNAARTLEYEFAHPCALWLQLATTPKFRLIHKHEAVSHCIRCCLNQYCDARTKHVNREGSSNRLLEYKYQVAYHAQLLKSYQLNSTDIILVKAPGMQTCCRRGKQSSDLPVLLARRAISNNPSIPFRMLLWDAVELWWQWRLNTIYYLLYRKHASRLEIHSW